MAFVPSPDGQRWAAIADMVRELYQRSGLTTNAPARREVLASIRLQLQLQRLVPTEPGASAEAPLFPPHVLDAAMRIIAQRADELIVAESMLDGRGGTDEATIQSPAPQEFLDAVRAAAFDTRCEHCGRIFARGAYDVMVAAMCPRKWARRDPESEADCNAAAEAGRQYDLIKEQAHAVGCRFTRDDYIRWRMASESTKPLFHPNDRPVRTEHPQTGEPTHPAADHHMARLLAACDDLDAKAADATPGGKTRAERWVAVEVPDKHWLIRTENDAGYGRMIGQTAGCQAIHAAFAVYIAAADPVRIREMTKAVRTGFVAQRRVVELENERDAQRGMTFTAGQNAIRAGEAMCASDRERDAAQAEVERLRLALRAIDRLEFDNTDATKLGRDAQDLARTALAAEGK